MQFRCALRSSPALSRSSRLRSQPKNRWAVERHLNVPRGTPPYNRGSRDVALVAVCNRPALLTQMAEKFSNSLDLTLARTPQFSKSNFSDAASCFHGTLEIGRASCREIV